MKGELKAEIPGTSDKKPTLHEKDDLRASFLRHASTKQNQNNKLSEEW